LCGVLKIHFCSLRETFLLEIETQSILLLELLNQGVHHERYKTFYLQQNNNAKIGRWSFENRLNNILSLLGDKWLDQSQTTVKKMLNNIIKENIPAKCS
jgi:hypothetical protein